jgi:putative flavoprotein involved in K+ transport
MSRENGVQSMDAVDVVVVGGGQAGLATSKQLSEAGVDHVVLERHRIGQAWRDRWDSFTLVLPNWTLDLPGFPFAGSDPDGFLPRDDIVAYLEAFATSFDAPVREGVEVVGLEQNHSGWTVRTPTGGLAAQAVVVASGAFQRAHLPPGWDATTDGPVRLDVNGYRNPQALPDGKVLVVGSGQSGCQIAADLAGAGREVFLACGRAPWLPRRAANRDIFWWIWESGFMETPVTALEDPAERLGANPQLSGRDGGHDLHFRTLHSAGVTLLGHLTGFDGDAALFADDLTTSLAAGDEAFGRLRGLILQTAAGLGMQVDDLPEPEPFRPVAPEQLDLTGFAAVISAGGFRPNYQQWLDVPGALDPAGFPVQDMTGQGPIPGLHFVGAHFLRKRKSALLCGVGEDAALVVERIAER